MSWNLTATTIEAEKVQEQLTKAKNTQLEAQPFDSWDDDVEPQIDAAISTAKAIIQSGKFGDGPFNVSLNGHAPRNKGEYPAVTVSVTGAPAERKVK